MADLTAQRTLVKSPPELWSEVSEIERLAKHLGELGEITITKAVPETTVAWEGESISGTVELEQSGWGTRVTLHATVPEPDPPAAPEIAAAPEPIAVEPEPEPVAVEPEPEPVAVEPEPDQESGVRPEPISIAEPDDGTLEAPADTRGFWARLLGRPPRVAEPVERHAPEAPTIEFDAIAVEPEPEPDLEPGLDSEPEPDSVAVEPIPEPASEPPIPSLGPARVQEILDGTLDALGQAHHRPFSRG
jgi:hypothetical protein